MPPIKRDSEELRELLKHHSVVGYPVRVPILDSAVIVSQEGTGPVRRYTDTSMELGSPQIAYVVKPVHDVPFSEWAKGKGLSTVPMNLEAWDKKYGQRTRHGTFPMLMEMREDLERGELVSEAQAEYGLVRNAGCLTPDDLISCATFWAHDVDIPLDKLKRGMLVEFGHATDTGSVPGRIVGFEDEKKIVLLEVFTPVPYMETGPLLNAIVNKAIRKGFYSSKTYSIGYGTRQAFEDQGVALPSGNLIDGERQYILDEMMDIKVIEDFCEKHYPTEKHCLWMSILLYILPISLEGEYQGKFRPLPQNVVPSEYVVDYEHE